MQWVYNTSPELNARSDWPKILGICLSLTTLMAVTVCTRIYVRAFMIKSLGADDYVIVFSMVCSIIYNGLCIGQSRYGLGLPIALRPVVNLDEYSEINFSGRPFYMAGITGFKVALCLAYLRITGNRIKSRYRTAIWTVMLFAIFSHLGSTLVLLFQCSPIRKSWRPRTPGTCLPNDTTFYVLAAITIFCDVIIFLMPIPLLMKLQINLRRKVGLIGIFALGLFTTVCSVMRMVQINTIAKNGNSTMLVLWGTIEMNVGIFLTCLPSLTPIFTFFAQKSKTSNYGGYQRSPKNTTGGSYSQQSCSEPVQLKKFSEASAFSDTTAVQRTESEEDILPLRKVLMDIDVSEGRGGGGGGGGVGVSKKDRVVSTTGSILKTTEVEVHVHESEKRQEGTEDLETKKVVKHVTDSGETFGYY